MGANAFEYNVKLNLNADTNLARTQINSLQQQLKSISNLQFNFNGINALTSEINEASSAALKLQTNLQTALNPNTGNLDFSKFTASIQRSGDSLQNLSSSLLSIGPQGTKAFISLADSISRSEVPLVRTNKLVDGLWSNLKKTAGWQISSSVIHGLMGSVQQAMGYAQALDKSLTDIRIVTGQSAEQMARFAKEANKAAKQLSATTTDYTNASLIYYQQGLSDAEVKKRSEITIKMANATGTSAEKVSNQMTAIWNNFADGSKSLEHYADVMTALGAATASSTDEIAKGLQKFASISDTVGLSYEYAASALATITATTRESADTVGNSLKTLFSRIQGLQLGETLDDGTTLNKYSTALAKVGISIKDTSGQLRDMDAILDDMGTKWHTLAEDQKMALAQTVGGVRQYTQIMTLMENWDFFKDNLITASTATGALTQQAAIYADSWEAAQKRMKASWETMWDSLIDSDSFKKILNIGSTIVESLGKAFAGLGGTGGVLGSAFSIFGNVFKDQLSGAIGNGLYNLTHMTPKVRKAAMDERIRTVQSMANTIRDPVYNPNMGDAQRNIIANQIESQAQQRIAYAQNSKYMNSQDIALYTELDKRVQSTRESRRQIAEQIDAGSMLVAHGRYADDSDIERFTRDYQTPSSRYGSTKSKTGKAEIDRIQQFGWALTQEHGLMFDEQGNRLRDSAASLGDVLETLGTRSAVAGQDIQEMTAWLASGQKRTAEDIKNNQDGTEFTVESLYQKTGKGYSGTAYEMYRDLLGITKEESAKINSGDLKEGTREYALNKILSKELKGLQGVIDSSVGKTDTERAQAIQGYLQKSVAGIGEKALQGLGVSTDPNMAIRRGGTQIFTGAKQRKEGELRDKLLQASEEKDVKEMDELAQKRIDIGRSVTSGLLGASGTASGLAGLEGAYSSLLNGNIAGVATGVGSAAMNFRMANQNYTEMFQGFNKIITPNQIQKGRKFDLLKQQKNLSDDIQAYKDSHREYVENTMTLSARNISLTPEERKQLEERQAFLKPYVTGDGRKKYNQTVSDLQDVNKELDELENVDIGKLSSEKLQKISKGFNEIANNAQTMATAIQVATVTFKAVNSALTYIADTNKRNAENSNKAATQLQSAYAMNQNNHNALLSSIDQYDQALNKAMDVNLKGAEKQAAIYEQNSIATDLIAKYGISEYAEDGTRNYTRVGDTIQITDKALEAAKAESISNMAVSKYAADRAKVDAKIASNDYNEETLERKMGMSENGWFTGAALGAGLAGGAGVAALMGSAALAAVAGPIGWAALAIGAGLATAGAINMAQRDDSIVDEAIEISKSQGSMAWLDNIKAGDTIDGKTFTESELKKLRENRDEIDKLVKGEQAADLQSKLMAENTARDILNTNEETKEFEYADKLTEGLVKQQEDWYKDKNNYNGWDTSKAKIAAAKDIEDELGLSGKNVVWSDDNKNGRLTYTYTENGQQQTGELSYDSLETMEATKKGKEKADKYVSQMMDAYETIKTVTGGNEEAAAGMLSLLSGGNFESATVKEIEEAKKLLQGLTDDQGNFINTEASYDKIAKQLGIYDENQFSSTVVDEYAKKIGYTDSYELANMLAGAENYSTSAVSALNSFREKNTEINEWFEGDGKQIYESMSQSTLKSFYSKLTQVSAVGGEDAAENFLNSLTTVLNEADIDVDDYGKAMESLLALDWSSADIDTNIIEVLESLGGEIDLTSASFENLINVMKNTNLAIPDFESKMNQLSQLYGSIDNLKMGDKLSAEDFQSFKEAGYDLSEYTMKQWDGSYTILGDLEDIEQKIHDNLLNTYDEFENYADIYEKYFGEDSLYHFNDNTFKNLDLSQLNWLFEAKNGPTYAGVDVYNKVSYLEDLGLNGEGIQALYDEQQTAANLVNKYKLDAEGKVIGYYNDTNEDGIINSIEMTDDNVTMYSTNAERIGAQADYDAAALRYNTAYSAGQAIIADIEAQTTKDWESLTKEERQQVASTYNTLDKFEAAKYDGRGIIYDADGNLTAEGQQQLQNLALQYPELIEYANAYNEALENNDITTAKILETQIKTGIAAQESLQTYTAMTGKKADLADLNATITALKNGMDEATAKKYQDSEGNWNEEELIKLAEETMIAGVGWSALQKSGSSWATEIGYLKNENATAAQLNSGYEAAGSMGKAMQQYLGLTEYDISGITKQDKDNPIVKAINELNIDISKILNKDVGETQKLRSYLVSQSSAGLSLSNKLGITGYGTKDATGADNKTAAGRAYNKMKGAYDEATGILDEETFAEGNSQMIDALNAGEVTWEEYQAAVEMSSGGTQRAMETGRSIKYGQTWYGNQNAVGNTSMGSWGDDKSGASGITVYDISRVGNQMIATNAETGKSEVYDPSVHGTAYTTDGSEMDPTKTTTGGGGGGGGGGPTKVQVKSAQELMTRYKVIDQKTTINDMQKTAALQAKDLLYGQSKINQLNTINTLLRKQQQLTSDRISEELDYLEKDKKKIEELIERYNKDAKDEDKINLEYDGFGIITNYKQVIGKWAEELASYYADGELTAEEGKKAEELQKKIQDFTTLIKDYEDSLNQLMTSIETFENTLYELFSNQMEALTYKVQYKIEIEQDDLSYIDFYSSSIKDSYSMMYTYLELVGSKISEMSGQMAIYQSGYEDLIAFADSDPMQLWATQGVEGILTAEQIETARSYRDSMISLYQSAVAARKEIEEQVLRTFDKWNDKINKNITDISRFTDMLAQFKDIINIVGKETLGLSDAFMKTFEQNSINQSMDNIAASRSQYENLVKTYEQSQSKLLEAQQRLEAAKASGDEGVIATAERDVEYWESIADKTQEEMQSAEDTMLTTLNHTLTMISEQFTNAITQAVDDFNDSIYQFNGLDGLVADYEQIREQQDLMVADYEKIYSLNKLNRDLERTLDNSKLTAGRAKLLEIQKEIHDLNKSNVELSRYDLEYLQAKYDLKVAEMELDNARNTKDTVMLSKDSEGNWSYIYSQNTNVVEEAEQKVEDSLFRMQQLSQQYTEEMSAAMMSISQQMRDELSALSIQDFESEEAYYEERQRIQEKYSAQLAHREEELNKAIANNAALYNEDWANYSEMTGYKISADQDWVDSFSETTLGGLIGSTSDISDYSILIADSTNKMNEALSAAASTYFVNADKALKTYGSSLKTFGSTVTTTTNGIISSSEKAVKEVSTMGATLVTEFEKITDKVEEDLAKWAEDIGNTLTALLDQIEAINKKIADSASKSIPETTEMIGQEEAAELLSKETFNNAEYAGWEFDGTRAVHNGMDIVQFNGELVKDVNEALQAYANTKIGSPQREEAAKKLEEVIADYWKFKKILERIYDPTNIDIEDIETPDITEMSSGGYTGEWGNEGKYAVLHEKELVLNKDDTSNFLEALTVSKQLMELIELNARASSQGLGEMHAATIQDSLQNFEQQIQITAEFPDATDHNEIEQAFDNLINMASQYAHRYK